MYIQQGFKSIKMKVGLNIKDDIKNVIAVRKSIGNEIDLLIDANHAYNVNH